MYTPEDHAAYKLIIDMHRKYSDLYYPGDLSEQNFIELLIEEKLKITPKAFFRFIYKTFHTTHTLEESEFYSDLYVEKLYDHKGENGF